MSKKLFMGEIENNSLKVLAANVEINREKNEVVKGSELLKLMFSNQIEGSSVKNDRDYVEISESIIQTNHFLLMLQLAFNGHKPIVITPDDIWLLICHGVSEHIKLHSDDFKGVFSINEKQTILVRRNDFVIGEDNPWEEVFPEFTKEIQKSVTEDLYSDFVLNFSTSSAKEINAFEIAFMDSMSNYFDYEFISLCGIPEIELKGTVEDYFKILDALEGLRKYNLSWWVDQIIPCIDNFVKAFQGKVDNTFWNSIYKENNISGGPFITGWIAKFFPYVRAEIYERHGVIDYDVQSVSKSQIVKTIKVDDLEFGDELKIHNVLIKNPRLIADEEYSLTLDHFPLGISSVSFKWIFIGKELKMNFASGFIGITESESNQLKTDINWVVIKK